MRRTRGLAIGLLVLVLIATATEATSGGSAGQGTRLDQGLNGSEEQSFATALGFLLENPDVDMVITMRRGQRAREGCALEGQVYWVYAARGTICFTRQAEDGGWNFQVDRVTGRNPLAGRDQTALATLADERAASSAVLNDPEPRNLVDPDRVTYPYAYERIVAEFDSPRAGDFVVVPANAADRGNKGAHGNIDVVQSRTTLLIAGRGARRSPLSAEEERALKVKLVDVAPTVAQALGVHPFQQDTGEPARRLNGTQSSTALLERQDGRVLDALLEPVFNTYVIAVGGLRSQDVTPTLMPTLSSLLEGECKPGGACASRYERVGRAVRDTRAGGALGSGPLLAAALFEAIESSKPWLRTAAVWGTEAEDPERAAVPHPRPDFVGGATIRPTERALDCPAGRAGAGFATGQCVMDVTLRLLSGEDPDLTLVDLPAVAAQSGLFGTGSPEARAAVADADRQIGRLVDRLRESGKWQHAILVVLANHGPIAVLSGGTFVRDRSVADRGQVDLADLAATVAWIQGVELAGRDEGRVLREAFVKHPQAAQRAGDITEPIANRAAIFIFDANNSVDVHCLLDPTTCGEPVPPEATDPSFIPTLRQLAQEGTLLRYGAIAAWPSVTFPNHNTVGNGAYPGHHGMVNNRFYLREEKEFINFFDSQQFPFFTGTSRFLTDGVETLHEAVHRTFGDWMPDDGPDSEKAFTAAVNDPSARGADYATLEPSQSFPSPFVYIGTHDPSEREEDTTQSCADQSPDVYEANGDNDHLGQTQARRLFDTHTGHPIPKYLINNFSLNDGAGHDFGPHTTCTLASYRDSDRRLSRILDAMAGAGVLGDTLIVVTGDHGMEHQDLSRRGLPSDFERFLDRREIEHVMADWHVYLLTMDMAVSTTDFRVGERARVTFTLTDDDTGDAVEGATVTVEGVEAGAVSGVTDRRGKVTLSFVPERDRLTLQATHDGFNPKVVRYRVG